MLARCVSRLAVVGTLIDRDGFALVSPAILGPAGRESAAMSGAVTGATEESLVVAVPGEPISWASFDVTIGRILPTTGVISAPQHAGEGVGHRAAVSVVDAGPTGHQGAGC